MPLKTTSVNTDKITYKDAVDLLQQLGSKGVPVANLSEEIAEGGALVYVPVTDPNWTVGDDTPSTYYATVWGKFQDVASISALMRGTLPWMNKFVNLASIAFVTDSPPLTAALALQAVDALTGVADLLNKQLALNVTLDPTMPTVVGSVPRIN